MTQDRPRPRPTHTVIVPGAMAAADVVAALLGAHCTFTVEYRERDVWHVGIFGDGLRVVTNLFGGVSAEAGAVKSWQLPQ